MPDPEHPTSIRQAELRESFKSEARYQAWLAKVKPEKLKDKRGPIDDRFDSLHHALYSAFSTRFLGVNLGTAPDETVQYRMQLCWNLADEARPTFHWPPAGMEPPTHWRECEASVSAALSEPRPIDNCDLRVLQLGIDDILYDPAPQMRDMTPAQKEEFARKYGEGAIVIAGFVIKRA